MQKGKNILLLLIAVFLIVMTISCPERAEASTNGHTQAEAVQWARDQVGIRFGECPLFVAYYYLYLGQAWPSCDYACDFLNGYPVVRITT